MQRLIHIASVSNAYISVYMGSSIDSGGAHTNNDLACATFDRQAKRRIQAHELMGLERARELLARISALLDSPDNASTARGYVLDSRSILIHEDGSIVLCALAPFAEAGSIYELRVGSIPGAEVDHSRHAHAGIRACSLGAGQE